LSIAVFKTIVMFLSIMYNLSKQSKSVYTIRRIYMKLSDLVKILDAQIVYGNEFLDREVFSACGSDMMSDVLAFVKGQAVLLTGLVNSQVVRTAEMVDMKCIVFVRGKVPDEGIIELAKSSEIVLLRTSLEMFTSCGLLYSNGLRGGSGK